MNRCSCPKVVMTFGIPRRSGILLPGQTFPSTQCRCAGTSELMHNAVGVAGKSRASVWRYTALVAAFLSAKSGARNDRARRRNGFCVRDFFIFIYFCDHLSSSLAVMPQNGRCQTYACAHDVHTYVCPAHIDPSTNKAVVCLP